MRRKRLPVGRLIFATLDGETFRGILAGAFEDVYVLEHASLVRAEGATDLAGRVFLPRGRTWLQDGDQAVNA